MALLRWTYQVLEAALDIHRRSNGLFDIRIAPALQKLGLLPYHTGDLAHGAALTSGHGAGALFVAADGEVYITPEWRDAAVLAA